LAKNSKRGVDYFLANSGGKTNSKNAGDQIGQFGNLCVMMSGGAKAYVFQVPDSAKQSVKDGVWTIEMEQTTVCVSLLGLEPPTKGGGGRGGHGGAAEAGDSLYTAKPSAGATRTGFALEVVEGAQRQHAALKVDKDAFVAGRVKVTDAGGKSLEVTYNKESDLPIVARDGEKREWEKECDLYKPVQGGNAPMSLGWKTGKLHVEAGGHVLDETVTADGKVTFTAK
jgi:hypothetical protein